MLNVMHLTKAIAFSMFVFVPPQFIFITWECVRSTITLCCKSRDLRITKCKHLQPLLQYI